MKAWTAAALAVAAAAAGFLAGKAVSVPSEAMVPKSVADRLEEERDAANVRAARAEGALVAEQRRRAAAAAPAPEDEAETPVPSALLPEEESRPAPADAAARAAEVRDLVAKVDQGFRDGDGEALLGILRRLAPIVPEGREAAMDLAMRINDDVNGPGALRLDVYTFYTSLGDTGMRDLMVWAIAEPSTPANFRVMSAYSLPWVLPGRQKVDVLVQALATERHLNVQNALIAKLVEMNDARAQAALAGILADAQREPGIRAQVATSFATSDHPDAIRSLEAAANADPDERVRAAAKAALVARNPPVDGFLVTIVLPDGAAQAAGVRPGDILVTYDGRPTRDVEELRRHIEAGGADTVPLVVLREGVETTLDVRRGRLGVQGRSVKRRS